MTERGSRLPSLLLFLSGVSALIYQLLWVKQLSLVVGIDVYAVTTAVSAFFAGLAVGGAVIGRLADRTSRPVRLYAILEALVAVTGLGATVALSHAAPTFVALQSSTGPLAWALPFALIGLPAFLMGGTLPTLVRATRPAEGCVGRASGGLYAANTAGAIVGTLVTPFGLVPALGVLGTAVASALLNVALAVVAFGIDRSFSPRPVDPSPVPPRPGARTALVLYALAGGLALGYEVVWSQTVVQFLSTRVYAFAIVLATYLTGLSLGSFLYARFADRVRRPWVTFGVLVAGAGLTALLVFATVGGWLPRAQDALGKGVYRIVESDMLANCARFALAGAVFVLVPTTLLGAAFPAAIRLIAGPERVGRDVGSVAALNTAGGIVGTVLTGFVLVPSLGLVRTMGALAIAAAALGGVALIRGAGRKAGGIAVAVLVSATTILAARAPRDALARLLTEKRGGRLVFYEESAAGTVAVVEQGTSDRRIRRLYIQGTSNTGDALTSLRYMRLQALLPLIVHRGIPRRALVVGLGTGITTGALLRYPSLEKRVCAELVPAVVRAASLFAGNDRVASDPRIDLRLRDARHELLRSDERYDLITLEPPPPTAASVVNLYSTDFYDLCRTRLESDGILAQWWPLHTQNEEDGRSLVRSFLDAFPHVALFTTELHEMLLVGSANPIELDVEKIRRRFSVTAIREGLIEVGVSSAAALLATYVTDREGLTRYVGDARPVTDDRPRIEHAGWVRDREITRVLPRVLEVRRDPPLLGADPEFEQDVRRERETLLLFYEAGLRAYERDREGWARSMAEVSRRDGGNAYYRWVAGK